MSLMTTYKPGQGRQMRTGISVLLVLITFWGCYSFMEYGNSKLDRLFGFEEPFFTRALMGDGSSLTGWFTPSFLLAAVVFFLAFFWLRKFLNKDKVADHLIGTELEMRRVNWPSKDEVMRSGSMVVYYTAMLALVIAILDLDMATIVSHYVLRQDLATSGWGRMLALLPGLSNNPMLLQIFTIAILLAQVWLLYSLSSGANKAVAESEGE